MQRITCNAGSVKVGILRVKILLPNEDDNTRRDSFKNFNKDVQYRLRKKDARGRKWARNITVLPQSELQETVLVVRWVKQELKLR